MDFEMKNAFSALEADNITEEAIEEGMFGYFADDKEHLKQAVENEKQNAYCYYGRLQKIGQAKDMRRFILESEKRLFSLFYYTGYFCDVDLY